MSDPVPCSVDHPPEPGRSFAWRWPGSTPFTSNSYFMVFGYVYQSCVVSALRLGNQ